MASNRWVAIDPDILTHPLVGAGQPVAPADPSRGAYSRMEAWVWIICNASFADHTVFNRGRKMTLKRGDLLGAWAFLAHTFNWSAKTVRAWIEKLVSDNMLQRRAIEEQARVRPDTEADDGGQFYGNQSTILSVVNYWRFQFDEVPAGQPKGNQKGNQLGDHNGNQSSKVSVSEKAEKYILQQQQGQPIGQAEGQPKGQHITKDIHNNVSSSATRKRASRRRSADDALMLDQALLAYNGAAEQFGFAKVGTFSPARIDTLERRLADIGGLENFKLALSAIPRNRFLMGQAAPRPGQQPFRLDFERLLSTRSGLGDVLAGLLDQAKSGEATIVGPNGKRWGWWRPEADKMQKTLTADYWRRALDAARPNGVWPWWQLGAPPGHSECLVHPDVVAERGLVAIYQGRIQHE